MNKYKSPYTAALTGGGFLFAETDILLPMLLSPDRKALLKEEATHNRLLHINSETSRKRNIAEIERRFDVMPLSFWLDYKDMAEADRRVALFYVVLKTYKICFDLHVNVAMRKWNGISKHLDISDLMIEMNEIAAADAFVDSWSDNSKKRVASGYLSILRKACMLDGNGELHPALCSNYDYYLRCGESWFLEACLLQPYEIESIKSRVL